MVQQDKGESYKMDKLKVRNAVKMVSPGRVAESSTHELPKTIRADQHAPTAQVPDGENLVHYNRCVDRCDLELQRKAVKCGLGGRRCKNILGKWKLANKKCSSKCFKTWLV